MSLTLRVVGPNQQDLGDNAVKVFAATGTIGRAASNDWVLPDTILYPTGGGTGLIGM